MLERIVHLLDDEDGMLPRSYRLLEVSAPDEAAICSLNTMPPVDWKERPEFTRLLGDTWLVSLETPLARVPSVVVPYTWNILLNPEHSGARQARIVSASRERFDNRLFRFGGH